MARDHKPIIYALLIWCICHATPIYAQDDLQPVVFIPGILGSKLEDEKGIVWGDALASVRRFSELQLSFENPEKTALRSAGILETIGVLGPFKVGQYTGIKQTFKDFGFVENKNLFYFHYDWRQSNFVTAFLLSNFIASNKQLEGRKITLVAHSMGGLVAHIYLREFGGAAKVTKLVTLATPHFGSGEAFWTFWNGLGRLKDFVLGGDDQVRRVVLSFPSMYELLPTYDKCCILGAPEDPQRSPTNILEFNNWTKFHWIPKSADSESTRKFVAKSLERATKLNELILSPLPPETRLIKIAGDLLKTYARVYLDRNTGVPVRWDQIGGDGTVPLLSAAANDLSDSDPAIHAHATIFDDEHVKLKLRRVLTRFNPLEKYAYEPVEGWVQVGPEKTQRRVYGLEISIGDTYQQAGHTAILRVRLDDEEGRAILAANVKANLIQKDGRETSLLVEQDRGGDYIAPVPIPSIEGDHKITVQILGLGLFEEHFVAIKK